MIYIYIYIYIYISSVSAFSRLVNITNTLTCIILDKCDVRRTTNKCDVRRITNKPQIKCLPYTVNQLKPSFHSHVDQSKKNPLNLAYDARIHCWTATKSTSLLDTIAILVMINE